MITVDRLDNEMIARICGALRTSLRGAIGRRVQFVFEEGIERIQDEGRLFESPNGTATFRLFIDGGAKDSGFVPEQKPTAVVQQSTGVSDGVTALTGGPTAGEASEHAPEACVADHSQRSAG